MKYRTPPTILATAAALALFGHIELCGAQLLLATGADADITEEGLHRVDPSIMRAAWVKPDFDLSRYTRILLMPTAVQFRDVPNRPDNARSRASTEEFRLSDERKEWLRGLWRRAIEAEFSRDISSELSAGVDADVLVVQVFLIDVVSRIPPDTVGSSYAYANDPWSATILLELRDPMTAELIARTIDRRHGQGLLELGEVWYRTEDLIERWAEVLSERLQELSDLGGRDTRTPIWAR